MTRIVKTAKERKLEIIQTAARLFRENGYSKTSVEQIIKEIGVAKGTFYYYFKSKEDVLEAIVEQTLDEIVEAATELANTDSLDAMSKLKLLMSSGNIGNENSSKVVDYLHLPENRQLHEITNIQTVLRLSPVLAKIVKQGNDEKIFNVKNPLETMEFLLTGSQFLFDAGLFEFTETELTKKRKAMQEIIEKSLGANPGTFSFLSQNNLNGETE